MCIYFISENAQGQPEPGRHAGQVGQRAKLRFMHDARRDRDSVSISAPRERLCQGSRPRHQPGFPGLKVIPRGLEDFACYSPRTVRRPWSISIIFLSDSRRTCSVRSVRSRVRTWLTLTTEVFPRPDSLFAISTLPGAAESRRLDVMAATTTVAIRLELKGLDWTTRTGRRRPGPDPVGSGSEAHQISPRFIFQHGGLSSNEWLIEP